MNEFYVEDGPERCGFVLKTGDLIEVENIAKEPETGFEMSAADIRRHLYTASGTWHTHPKQCANLSMADYRAFMAFPQWDHFIIGHAGDVRRYYVENGALLCAE